MKNIFSMIFGALVVGFCGWDLYNSHLANIATDVPIILTALYVEFHLHVVIPGVIDNAITQASLTATPVPAQYAGLFNAFQAYVNSLPTPPVATTAAPVVAPATTTAPKA